MAQVHFPVVQRKSQHQTSFTRRKIYLLQENRTC